MLVCLTAVKYGYVRSGTALSNPVQKGMRRRPGRVVEPALIEGPIEDSVRTCLRSSPLIRSQMLYPLSDGFEVSSGRAETQRFMFFNGVSVSAGLGVGNGESFAMPCPDCAVVMKRCGPCW